MFTFVHQNVTDLENKPLVIGICGGSGSGKTTVVEEVMLLMQEEKPSLLSMDNYYIDISEQVKDTLGRVNFDLPTALNTDLFFQDLNKLKQGSSLHIKKYAFNMRNQVEFITIPSSKIILTEGIFLFHVPGIMDILDIKIFIDLDAGIQLERRLKRDVQERGYSEEDVLYQWHNHVIPAYENFIKVYRNEADLVLCNAGDPKKLVKQIEAFILNHPQVKRCTMSEEI